MRCLPDVPPTTSIPGCCPQETNRRIFRRAMQTADVAVVEGMMGLFDGANGHSDEGSTAEIAKLLGLPVVLVVDASNSARSIGAVVMGFRDFDPRIRIAGVILNGVAGAHHLNLLRESIAPIGVPVLGSFPRLPELSLRERHLGLVTAGEETWNAEQVETSGQRRRNSHRHRWPAGELRHHRPGGHSFLQPTPQPAPGPCRHSQGPGFFLLLRIVAGCVADGWSGTGGSQSPE